MDNRGIAQCWGFVLVWIEMFGGRIGLPELFILLVLPVLFTVAVYTVGKKIGYGKALRDVAEGKFPTLTDKKSNQ